MTTIVYCQIKIPINILKPNERHYEHYCRWDKACREDRKTRVVLRPRFPAFHFFLEFRVDVFIEFDSRRSFIFSRIYNILTIFFVKFWNFWRCLRTSTSLSERLCWGDGGVSYRGGWFRSFSGWEVAIILRIYQKTSAYYSYCWICSFKLNLLHISLSHKQKVMLPSSVTPQTEPAGEILRSLPSKLRLCLTKCSASCSTMQRFSTAKLPK